MTAAALPLTPEPDEVPMLRSAMHDIQVSTANFYAQTAQQRSVEQMATCVRSTTSFIQVLNDLLLNESSVADAYKAMFEAPVEPGVEILLGFKYVRNVMQHVLHPIEPEQNALIGGLHGVRAYFLWVDVPDSAHLRLRTSTRVLRPYFDQRLRGREVADTFLSALAALAAIVPAIVHRDEVGEWTGFPLPEQPGVAARLHPEATK